MAGKTRRKPTPAEQEARKAQRAERAAMLKTAADSFELDEDNGRLMRAFDSLVTHYSEGNAMLILAQAEALGLRVRGIDDVGGFGPFRERGRQVRKGERQSIFIWAPAGSAQEADRVDDADAPSETTAEGVTLPMGGSTRRFFKVIGIFHVSQTDKIVPTPLDAVIDEATQAGLIS